MNNNIDNINIDNINKKIKKYNIKTDKNLKKAEKLIEEILLLIEKEKDNKKEMELKMELNKLKNLFYENKEELINNSNYPIYPDKNDENFLEKLLSKKEFFINRYNKKDFTNINNDFFELSKNQKFIKKLISPETQYRTLLLFHGVGVGKTCSSIQISQNFKKVYSKKTLVILPSQLKGNFKKQLFDILKYSSDNNFIDMQQCLGNYYLNKITEENKKNIKSLTKSIDKLIDNEYEFLGKGEFSNLVKNIKKKSKNKKDFDKKLINYFDDRVIIVDEVHNMRILNEDKSGKDATKFFQYILSKLQNHVLVLLTATPMFNSYEEIKFILNLINLSENKVSLFNNVNNIKIFNDDDKLTKNFTNILKNISNKYISYMRGENPYTFPVRISPVLYNDKNILNEQNYPKKDIYGNLINTNKQIKYLNLTKTSFSDLQKKIYNEIKVKNLNKLDDDEDDSGDFQQMIQISNITFPSDTVFDINDNKIELNEEFDIKDCYGEKGFLKIFKKNEKTFSFKYKNKILKRFGEILNFDVIEKYSSKMKLLIDNIINSDGKVLIYSKYLYSGVIPLCICLEHLGITNINNNILDKSNLSTNNLKILSKTKNLGSYAIISGNKFLSVNNSKIVEKLNNNNNINGEKIKFVFITESGSEGLDLKGIRQIHILEPWYNINRLEQIIGRGVRNFSHFDLEEEKRNCVIYNYININDEEKDRETKDFRMYRISENKQKKISIIERVIKENSIDCALNKYVLKFSNIKKNIEIPDNRLDNKLIKDYDIGDKDNTKICDYMSCNFKCSVKINKSNINTSTFNKNILNSDIRSLIEYIKIYYNNNDKISYTLEELKDGLKNVIIDDTILYYSLDKMLKNKIQFQINVLDVNKDKQNKNSITYDKITGFLIKRKDKYIFQPEEIDDKKLLLEDRVNKKTGIIRNVNIEDNIIINTNNNSKKDLVVPKNMYTFTEYLKNIYIDLVSIIEVLYFDKKIDKTQENIHKQVIWDIIIDSLKRKDILQIYYNLINNNFGNVLNKYIENSLKKQNLIIYDSNNKITNFYNYFDNKYMCINLNNNLVNCDTELNEILLKKYKKYISDLKEKNLNILAYNEINKEKGKKYNSITMKVIDLNKKKKGSKVSGTSCEFTSSIKVKDYENYINNFSKGLLRDDISYKKRNLCLIYQFILRLNSTENDIYFLSSVQSKHLLKYVI
jgi:hypothetical protein